MNIFYFERMRVFSSGEGRLILKLRLPRSGIEPLDKLYLSIASEALAIAESLSRGGISGTLSVNFKALMPEQIKLPRRLSSISERLVIIERTHSARLSALEYNNRYIDIYDTGRNILVR